jgi:hypothetical protein
MQTWWKVPSIDEGIFQQERERERERESLNYQKVVEVHETREMLSNAKEKNLQVLKCFRGRVDSRTLAISTHVC